MTPIMTQTPETPPSLIEFPAQFPIKVMGKNSADFRALVLATCQALIPEKQLLRVDEQLSSSEKYLSCTIVAVFHQQTEIDAVYQRLTASPLVLMAL